MESNSNATTGEKLYPKGHASLLFASDFQQEEKTDSSPFFFLESLCSNLGNFFSPDMKTILTESKNKMDAMFATHKEKMDAMFTAHKEKMDTMLAANKDDFDKKMASLRNSFAADKNNLRNSMQTDLAQIQAKLDMLEQKLAAITFSTKFF